MPVLKRNVEYAFEIATARDNKPYGYGGVWKPDNVWATTDCSGIVTHILDALLHGNRMAWSRHGLSTEAYRYVGGPGSHGPFGTIRVRRPHDIPDHAALRIGLVHGPGGGSNSHMACTLEGTAIESSGTHGQRIGPPARGYDHPLFNDWFYLPGPITDEDGTPGSPLTPYPSAVVFLRLGSTGNKVRVLQNRLNRDYPLYANLVVDGQFGPQTEMVVMEFQRRSGLVVDGIAGPATLTLLGLPPNDDDAGWSRSS
jgi:hypothetical protein